MSILHQQKSFLETNAWQKANLNSLRYNTSQPGSVIPIVYGTTRVSINLIALGDYRGPSGKKGKVGPLPLTGTRTSSKGKGGSSGGKKATGGKKSGHYSVDVDFGICQGPVDIGADNKVWASPGTAFFHSIGLNLYTGEDGQAVDPVFDGLGDHSHYSGTCHVTGTPMDLGNSPVLPNISFEVTGFEVGTAGTGEGLQGDANPASVVEDFLTNDRYGAGWPAANLDPDISTEGANGYGDYCRAVLIAVSPALTSQTDAATWVAELVRLTNVVIVWSGYLLKFIPYGDLALSSANGSWTPNLTPVYSFTDDDFLPWSPHIDAGEPQLGEDDPVLIIRSNPSDATNWMSIEYLDRENDYNKTVLPQFDQGSIDLYGLRTESAVNGNCFCEKVVAERSLRLLLQRAIYVRNTYRFQVGWKYSLLEPMDIVLLTDAGAGLFEQAVRITAIEENENGDLIIDAEEIKTESSPVETGCVSDAFIWRTTAPGAKISAWNLSPDRLDSLGNYYTGHVVGGDESRHIYDSGGTEIVSMSYSDLWDAISAFVLSQPGADPFFVHRHQLIPGSTGSGAWMDLWPIDNGEYILAHAKLYHYQIYTHSDGSFWFTGSAGFSEWWALLEPGDRSVLGACWVQNPTTAWPYTNGTHVLGAVSKDQPIYVQCYAFVGSDNAAIGALPSIDELLLSAGAEINNTMFYPIGGATSADTDFGYRLLGDLSPTRSRNFGFILPDADGGVNYYIYVDRKWMDLARDGDHFTPPELRDVIQPANPNGCMIKIALGERTFTELAAAPPHLVYHNTPTGAYTIDNASWRESDGVTAAIPFLDEYTRISDDSTDDSDLYFDAYSAQTGVIKRGHGKYWVIFYMVGYADALYRNGAASPPVAQYTHPIYERVRVFEYTASTETAREIARQTCYVHDASDIAVDSTDRTYEYVNDSQQVFSVDVSGTTATLYIHGYVWKRAFMTFSAPISV